MRCRQCQTENREGAKFCSECGAPLDRVCSACGSTNPPGAKFCNECGAKLDAAPSPPAAVPLPAPETSSDLNARLTRAAPPSFLDKLRQLPAQAPGERRKVTILFADLKGSTALGEKLDAEEIYDLMN